MKPAYFKSFIIFLCLIFLNACGGSSGGSGGSTPPGPGPKPTPTNVSQMFAIGNITPIPVRNGVKSQAYVFVDNNSNYTLYSPKIYINEKEVGIVSDYVDATLCGNVASRGTCSISITPPQTTGNFVLRIDFSYVDNKGILQTETQKQIVAYSDNIPAYNGFTVSSVNNNMIKKPNTITTLSIPFILEQDYSSIKIVANSKGFSPQESPICTGLTKGSSCTSILRIDNIGDIPAIGGNLTFIGTSLQSTDKAKKQKSQINSTSNVTIPFTVINNTAGNLINSGINLVINPSDGTAQQIITLLNNGNAPISQLNIVTSGAPLTVTPYTGGTPPSTPCSMTGGTLAAQSTCTFAVNANSTISGQGSVIINYNNGQNLQTQNTNVIYSTKSGDPVLTLTTGQPNIFAGTLVGSTSIMTITVKNNSASATFSALKFGLNVTGGTNAITYVPLTPTSTTTPCIPSGSTSSISLAPQASCIIQLQYAPTTAGETGTFSIPLGANYTDTTGSLVSYNALYFNGTPYSSVTGIGWLNIVPSAVNFTIPADGSSSQAQTFTVTNYGSTTVTINNKSYLSSALTAANPPNYNEITGTTCVNGLSLAQNASCVIVGKYGPTTAAISPATYYLTLNYTPYPNATYTSTTSSQLNFYSSGVVLSNVTTSGGTCGTGVSLYNCSFINTAPSVFTITFQYKNIGTTDANNFNVNASNNIPTAYTVITSQSTCPIGSTGTTSLAAGATCNVAVAAINPNLPSPYTQSGRIDMPIPGYSYIDASSGVNLISNPSFSYPFGSTTPTATVSSVTVTANLFANITTNTPTITRPTYTVSPTFTAAAGPTFPIYITIIIPSGSGLTLGGTACSFTAAGTCSTQSLTVPTGTPAGTYYYKYIISTTSGGTTGIPGYGSFILN